MVGGGKGADHWALGDPSKARRSRLKVGGVFIFIGFKPNSNLVEGHFKHDAGGYFVTDDRMMTSIPGLFVAGGVRSQLPPQITPAPGGAPTAPLAREKDPAAPR